MSIKKSGVNARGHDGKGRGEDDEVAAAIFRTKFVLREVIATDLLRM